MTHRLLFAACVLPFVMTACGAGTDNPTTGGGGASSSSSSGEFTGGGGGHAFGGMSSCEAIDRTAIARPLNLYIMLDRSTSMRGTKLNAAVAGIEAFIDDAASGGINLAFNSFPKGAAGCDQTVYQTPSVGWGELPGIAPQVSSELQTVAADGFSTPIYQALGGALLAGVALKSDSPDESAAVLLVTDGLPQGPSGSCGGVNPEDPQAIANLATAAYGFGVSTFVIGLPGVDQSFANLVAAAGGTEKAILVSTQNPQTEFRAALAKVRGELLPCEYFIPEEIRTGEVGVTFVNVAVGLLGGEPEVVPQNPQCDGDGWYYDVPTDPTTIILCPSTCDALSSDATASIAIRLGCSTIVK